MSKPATNLDSYTLFYETIRPAKPTRRRRAIATRAAVDPLQLINAHEIEHDQVDGLGRDQVSKLSSDLSSSHPS